MRGLLLCSACALLRPAAAQTVLQTPVLPQSALPIAAGAGLQVLLPSTLSSPAVSPLVSPAAGLAALPTLAPLRIPAALPRAAVEPVIPAVQGAPIFALRAEDILRLRPTQFSAGMREVEEKSRMLRDMKPKERERYLRDHPIPVAVGPGGALYILDHHHLALGALDAGLTQLPVEVRADLSDLDRGAFWKEMRARSWTYLYDEGGGGPHDPADLPADVRGLADDPYRSVAWQVRERGGYRKTDEFFIEFRWADFFRKHLEADPSEHFKRAVEEAMDLARSPLARDLPGYLGPRYRGRPLPGYLLQLP